MLIIIIIYKIMAVIGKIKTLRLAYTVYGFKIYVIINSGVIFNFINY